MAEDESNWCQQADEIEALSAIYGDQFHNEDDIEKKFSIEITDGKNIPHYVLSLQVKFCPNYPSDAPPTYQLNAPWLRGDERSKLCNYLEDIYCDNLGETVVYKWVERIREFILDKTTNTVEFPCDSPEHTVQSSDDMTTISLVNEGKLKSMMVEDDTEDYNDDEYGFDPSLHIYKPHVEAGDITDGDIELPVIHHGEFIKDRKSVFQGHLSPITHKKQVQMVLDKLKENKKIAAATHNIIAYRIDGGNGVFVTGCVDDGEIHAGSRMLHLLTVVDARNVLVIVTRWYGGVHLGPDRFKHINNCTRDLLEAHGYIKEKAGTKKGPKSHAAVSPGEQTEKAGHGQKHKKGK